MDDIEEIRLHLKEMKVRIDNLIELFSNENLIKDFFKEF